MTDYWTDEILRLREEVRQLRAALREDEIERLRQENERLRAALKEIVEYEELTHGATWAQARARRALEGK